MKRKLSFVIGGIAVATLLCVAIVLASKPPSDEALIRNFSLHRGTFDELTRMFITDRREAVIGATGSVWPQDLRTQGMTQSRIDQYRQRLAAIGVASIAGSGEPDIVVFQLHAPLQLPVGPVKSYVYSTRPPPLLTDDNTDNFVFAPSQRQRVCREIAEYWYVCIDHED